MTHKFATNSIISCIYSHLIVSQMSHQVPVTHWNNRKKNQNRIPPFQWKLWGLHTNRCHAHLSPNQANTCALHNYIGAADTFPVHWNPKLRAVQRQHTGNGNK